MILSSVLELLKKLMQHLQFSYPEKTLLKLRMGLQLLTEICRSIFVLRVNIATVTNTRINIRMFCLNEQVNKRLFPYFLLKLKVFGIL